MQCEQHHCGILSSIDRKYNCSVLLFGSLCNETITYSYSIILLFSNVFSKSPKIGAKRIAVNAWIYRVLLFKHPKPIARDKSANILQRPTIQSHWFQGNFKNLIVNIVRQSYCAYTKIIMTSICRANKNETITA